MSNISTEPLRVYRIDLSDACLFENIEDFDSIQTPLNIKVSKK